MDTTSQTPILGETSPGSVRAFHPKAWRHLEPLLPTTPPPSLEQLAHSQGLDLNDLLFHLNELEGCAHRFLPTLPMAERIRLTRPRHPDPASDVRLELLWRATPGDKRRTLDSRDLLQRGIDPFTEIQRQLATLPRDGVLLLLIPFQPLPLYLTLERLGYGYLARFRDDLWQVAIHRPHVEKMAAADTTAPTLLDVRGLPPPEPLVRILEATAVMKTGQSLHVVHDRLPHLLFPRLAERHLQVVTEENDAGEVHLYITKPATAVKDNPS